MGCSKGKNNANIPPPPDPGEMKESRDIEEHMRALWMDIALKLPTWDTGFKSFPIFNLSGIGLY